MHGQSTWFALLRNVEVGSMGGFIECGVGMDMKTSPRRAAIEKAHAELRKEYDVREERRRELEFLEKGGNPLDFKFAPAASKIVQSTSFTNQQAEQPVISEAKGGAALAASHGDSVGSSGRLGGSVGREPNIADNLSLLDGENSNPGVEKNVKHTGKRGNISLLEHSSATDGCANAKETEDSLIYHLGVKNQAYTRRNRSRTSRDSHNNKSTAPSSYPERNDANRQTQDEHADNHGISSVSDSKLAVPIRSATSKAPASDAMLDFELRGVQAHHSSTEVIKDGVREGEAEVNISEAMQETDHSCQQTSTLGEQAANFVFPKSSHLTGKDEATSVAPCLASIEPTLNVRDISTAERVGSSFPDEEMNDVMDDDVTRKSCVVGNVAEVISLDNTKRDTSHTDMDNDTVGDATDTNCSKVIRTGCRSTIDPKESPLFHGTSDNSVVREKCLTIGAEATIIHDDQSQPAPSNPINSVVCIKDEVDLCENRSDISNVPRPLDNVDVQTNGEVVPKSVRKTDNSLLDSSHSINRAGVITSSLVVPNCEPSTTAFLKRGATNNSALQNNAGSRIKLAKKAREDAILKEARIVEMNLKRAGQLAASYRPSDKRQKCHWDFVIEEMKWMANDFMQERHWKMAAAARVCHRIASTGRAKFEHEMICRQQRNIARTIAKAVMLFWHSVDVSRTTGLTQEDNNGGCNSNLLKSCKANGTIAEMDQSRRCTEAEKIGLRPAIQAYAIRFLKYDFKTSNLPVLVNGPTTPDRINDVGMSETSGEDEPSEEGLYYRIPAGAMQVYREAVESNWMNYKKLSNPMHNEDCESTPCDSAPGGPRENEYEEEEGETGSYVLPGRCEGTMPPKLTHKQKIHFQQKSAASRVYNVATDFCYEPFLEGKSANQTLLFTGKRPSNSVHAGQIPTKRVRTAARQRVGSPFSAAAAGNLQSSNKTDASSGDTDSLQDDQSSMHGGPQSWRNMEVESTADYEAQFPFDDGEIYMKSKTKNSKHLGHSCNSDSGVVMASGKGSIIDQRFQADFSVQNELRDQVKKRSESQYFESSGKFGTYGQRAAKKPKLLKQPTEPSPEAIMPAAGSMHSPVTSQMSYMSNQNKLIKIITNRDRGRKSKALKISARQSGSGISWTTFEDQALVVLVHDMGPNWELVSDAINSTLQFKCIFRKPTECKERHKILMDKSAGDGADSVEDSGSSQPYPSTLPGIPKGSAIQLFQRLQGPMEEDTLKSHFEKIILIGQRQSSCRIQKDALQHKQPTPVHSSHDVALSQTYPNNWTGAVLSPLDLCDSISSSPDVLTLGYQGSHTSGAPPPNHSNNQGYLSPVPSNSSANAVLQGSSGIVLGSNSPSHPASLNAPARDAQRYCMPRAPSLPTEDKQRLHYTKMLSSRNVQQSSMSVPGAFLPMGVDRGSHMLPNGNGRGLMGSRTMSMSRPGFQGINSPGMPMVSAGGMLAGVGIGMPNPANTHSVAVSSQGNSMLRPHDTLPVMRPGQITEDHRQMMMQDLQPQVSQGITQVMPSFNALSVPFSTGTGLPSVQPYPVQQHRPSLPKPRQSQMLGNTHHSHILTTNSSPQQQAYTDRLAKGRELQHRMGPRPQQSYSYSNTTPPGQNNSQRQQQSQSSSCPPTPSQAQHNKQQVPHNPQSSSGIPNQVIKQRQPSQSQNQQPGPQQQQKQLTQHQTKFVKGSSKGPSPMHQNPNVPSQASGTLPAPSKQVSEKDLIQHGHGFFHGSSGLKPNLPQSSNHHKLYSHPPPQTSKQIPPERSHSDTCSQTPMPVSSNQTLLSSQQPTRPPSVSLATPLQQQQQQQINQNTQRMMFQQNRQLNADGRIQSSCEPGQRVNKMILATSLPQCTDSITSAPLGSSAMQWKQDPSYDSSTTAPAAPSTLSSQGNLVGTETKPPPSSEGAEQRKLSGSLSMDGHGVGGQWQPKPPKPQP